MIKGNIDLKSLKRHNNADGSFSTIQSATYTFDDGKAVLLPTIDSATGRKLSDREVVDRYIRSGKHLGKFSTVEEADEYAEMLSKSMGMAHATDSTEKLAFDANEKIAGVFRPNTSK